MAQQATINGISNFSKKVRSSHYPCPMDYPFMAGGYMSTYLEDTLNNKTQSVSKKSLSAYHQKNLMQESMNMLHQAIIDKNIEDIFFWNKREKDKYFFNEFSLTQMSHMHKRKTSYHMTEDFDEQVSAIPRSSSLLIIDSLGRTLTYIIYHNFHHNIGRNSTITLINTTSNNIRHNKNYLGFKKSLSQAEENSLTTKMFEEYYKLNIEWIGINQKREDSRTIKQYEIFDPFPQGINPIKILCHVVTPLHETQLSPVLTSIWELTPEEVLQESILQLLMDDHIDKNSLKTISMNRLHFNEYFLWLMNFGLSLITVQPDKELHNELERRIIEYSSALDKYYKIQYKDFLFLYDAISIIHSIMVTIATRSRVLTKYYNFCNHYAGAMYQQHLSPEENYAASIYPQYKNILEIMALKSILMEYDEKISHKSTKTYITLNNLQRLELSYYKNMNNIRYRYEALMLQEGKEAGAQSYSYEEMLSAIFPHIDRKNNDSQSAYYTRRIIQVFNELKVNDLLVLKMNHTPTMFNLAYNLPFLINELFHKKIEERINKLKQEDITKDTLKENLLELFIAYDQNGNILDYSMAHTIFKDFLEFNSSYVTHISDSIINNTPYNNQKCNETSNDYYNDYVNNFLYMLPNSYYATKKDALRAIFKNFPGEKSDNEYLPIEIQNYFTPLKESCTTLEEHKNFNYFRIDNINTKRTLTEESIHYIIYALYLLMCKYTVSQVLECLTAIKEQLSDTSLITLFINNEHEDERVDSVYILIFINKILEKNIPLSWQLEMNSQELIKHYAVPVVSEIIPLKEKEEDKHTSFLPINQWWEKEESDEHPIGFYTSMIIAPNTEKFSYYDYDLGRIDCPKELKYKTLTTKTHIIDNKIAINLTNIIHPILGNLSFPKHNIHHSININNASDYLDYSEGFFMIQLVDNEGKLSQPIEEIYTLNKDTTNYPWHEKIDTDSSNVSRNNECIWLDECHQGSVHVIRFIIRSHYFTGEAVDKPVEIIYHKHGNNLEHATMTALLLEEEYKNKKY